MDLTLCVEAQYVFTNAKLIPRKYSRVFVGVQLFGGQGEASVLPAFPSVEMMQQRSNKLEISDIVWNNDYTGQEYFTLRMIFPF